MKQHIKEKRKCSAPDSTSDFSQTNLKNSCSDAVAKRLVEACLYAN